MLSRPAVYYHPARKQINSDLFVLVLVAFKPAHVNDAGFLFVYPKEKIILFNWCVWRCRCASINFHHSYLVI